MYSGLGPILLKTVSSAHTLDGKWADRARVLYTMASFVVYEHTLEVAYQWVDKSTISGASAMGINLDSSLVAGFAAAVVLQPADAVLSQISKERGEPGQGTCAHLCKISTETGLRRSYAGFRARLVMMGSMTAIQFAIYGDVKEVCFLFTARSRVDVKIDHRLTVVILGSRGGWRNTDQIVGSVEGAIS